MDRGDEKMKTPKLKSSLKEDLKINGEDRGVLA